MNSVSAFLLASGMAYIGSLALPKSTTNLRNVFLEKIGLGIAGGVILINLFLLNSWIVWMALGACYVLACILSYFGYVRWAVQWRWDMSDLAQMIMAVWDLSIAVCCLSKVY